MYDQTYLFYLKQTENTYYQVVNDGVITTTIKRPLDYSPKDWDQLMLDFSRNETNWGIFTKMAESISFVKDGMAIAEHIYYQYYSEGECILEIEKFNPTTMQYEFFGDGDLDFSQANPGEEDFGLSVMERGLNVLIEARRDIPYEIPLDDIQALDIKVDGLKIKNVVSYTPITFNGPTLAGLVSLTEIYRLSTLGQGNMPSTSGSGGIQYGFVASTNDPVIVRITNTKLVSVYASTFRIIKTESDGSSGEIIFEHFENIDGQIIPDTTLNIPMNTGQKLYFRHEVAPGTGSSGQILDVDSTHKASVEITAVLRFTPTTHKAFRYYHFLQKLVSKMTGGQFTVFSQFLSNTNTSTFRKANFDNSPWNTLVTCGNGIRTLPGAAIHTSLTDVFKDCWSRWCLGFGIENNVLRIEPLSYFLNKNLEIGTIQARDVRCPVYTAGMCNQVVVGYGNYDYDELSGKEEFNTSQTYSFGKMLRVKKEEDLKTPFRADMFGWEKNRNYLNVQSTLAIQTNSVDNTSDNDVFLLEVDPVPVSGFYVPYRPGISSISGLTFPESAYNITLSPKRIFLRHLPRLRSMLPAANRGSATFQVTDKNKELESNFTGPFVERIVERADVSCESDTCFGRDVSILFKPIKITGEGVPDKELRDSIHNNKYGFINLYDTYKERMLKGFVLDFSLQTTKGDPGNSEASNIILLAHPECEFG